MTDLVLSKRCNVGLTFRYPQHQIKKEKKIIQLFEYMEKMCLAKFNFFLTFIGKKLHNIY